MSSEIGAVAHPLKTGSPETLVLRVNPGVCGFTCAIKIRKKEKRVVFIELVGSECKQIQRLSLMMTEMTLKELFAPVRRNPVFVSAEKAGCHPSCPIPVAILKAVEVAMEMALPREVVIAFE